MKKNNSNRKMVSNEKAMYCFSKNFNLSKEESKQMLMTLKFFGPGVYEDNWYEEVVSKMKAGLLLSMGYNIFTKDGLRVQKQYSHGWYGY